MAYANVIEEDPEIIDYCWKEGDLLRVREQLGAEQRNIIKDQLRQMHLLTQSIPMRTAWPIQLKFYCIPIAYWEEVEQELQQMELNVIIKKSFSDWASLIVVVTK